MLTAFDKAIIPLLAALIAYGNQKFGLQLNASPEALTVLVGALTSIIVYFIPNKA